MNRKGLTITVLVATILTVAFVGSTLIAINTAVDISLKVNDENSMMHIWIAKLESMGWDIHHSPPLHGLAITYSESLPTDAVGLSTFDDWFSELQKNDVTTIYYRYANVIFPFQIQHSFLYFNRAASMSAPYIQG